MTAFHRLMEEMAKGWAELVLIDVGPNLGAINRAALIASDRVCVPVAPDIYSLQGLKNLGPALTEWRKTWTGLTQRAPAGLSLPAGSMDPVGYVVTQHSMGDSRPVKAYRRWMDKIPTAYRNHVLGEDPGAGAPPIASDPNCLSQLLLVKSGQELRAMRQENGIFVITTFVQQ